MPDIIYRNEYTDKSQSIPLSTNRFGRYIENITEDLAKWASDQVIKYERFAVSWMNIVMFPHVSAYASVRLCLDEIHKELLLSSVIKGEMKQRKQVLNSIKIL